MSTDRETTRIVRSWLDEGVTVIPDRVLDAVLDQVPATPQRRAWWPVRRLPTMSTATRVALAAAAVVVLAVFGIRYLLPSNNTGGPSRTATPVPTVTPAPLPAAADPLAPGTYSLSSPYPSLTFEVPAGSSACTVSAAEQGICLPVGDGTIVVAFLIVDNVVADPCAPDEKRRDPPVGPSVDDLVAAISNLKGFRATSATDISVDGFQGKQFTVTAPTRSGCELKTWATATRVNGVGAGEVNVIQILDVNGVRLVLTAAYSPQETSGEAALAEFLRISNSLHFVR